MEASMNKEITMATIKSYTDVAQSKTLNNILPSESADGTWVEMTNSEVKYRHSEIPFWLYGGLGIPSWSLAALLDVLPEGYSFVLTKSVNGEDYYCKLDGEPIEAMADNPVDAYYEMIIRLNELKVL